jgi:hypothetical protein
MGESMGGILGRIALKQLENEGFDHQIGLYVSYDAPHKGAYVFPKEFSLLYKILQQVFLCLLK